MGRRSYLCSVRAEAARLYEALQSWPVWLPVLGGVLPQGSYPLPALHRVSRLRDQEQAFLPVSGTLFDMPAHTWIPLIHMVWRLEAVVHADSCDRESRDKSFGLFLHSWKYWFHARVYGAVLITHTNPQMEPPVGKFFLYGQGSDLCDTCNLPLWRSNPYPIMNFHFANMLLPLFGCSVWTPGVSQT